MDLPGQRIEPPDGAGLQPVAGAAISLLPYRVKEKQGRDAKQMIFGQDKNELRLMYVEAWRKSNAGEALSTLELQIATVIGDHPEYQAEMTAESIEAAFTPEGGQANPFLHMGLHLAIREQVSTNRPLGISKIFNNLRDKLNNSHEAEHQMLECLAETLWEAQSRNVMPDEAAYVERLRRL